VKLKSATFVSQTRAAFSQLSTSAAVATLNRILADAQAGHFINLLRYFAEDGVRPSEEVVFVLFRYLADDSDVADLYIAEFNKAVDDSVGASDAVGFKKEFSRPVADAPAASEQYAATFHMSRTDGFSAADDAAKLHLSRVAVEETYFTDNIDTLSVSKSLADAGLAADNIDTFGVGKLPTDQPEVFDSINAFGTTKQLKDSLFVTDDIDGEASILDDQEVQFVKQRSDAAFIGDSIHINTGNRRRFSHTAATADDVVFSIGRTLSDIPDVSDRINMLTGKHINDIPVAVDTLAFALSRARTDSAFLGDANEAAFNKTLLERASIADAGSLRSQNYSDFTYFAEDYVGASRTF
jgi:hypothetical protein